MRKLASTMKLHEDMRAFVRVKLKTTKDQKGTLSLVAEPVSAAAASVQTTLTESDGVVIVENKKRLVKGQKVEVLLLRALGNPENGV